MREPDIPVLERNETGTGGSPPLIATLLQITGNGLKQAVAVPGLVRFSTEIPRQVQESSRDRRWFPAARPGCQARCQDRMDDEPSGEWCLELNTVATTRDAGEEKQLPIVWVAREDCRKAFCTDREWPARQRRRYAPRDTRPLPPRRWEFRGCHPGPRVGAGRARTVSGSRLRAVRKRPFQEVPRGRNDETWSTSKARNRRAVQPREQTSISWISQGMDDRSQSWPATRPCPVNPGLPGREDAATKCKQIDGVGQLRSGR